MSQILNKEMTLLFKYLQGLSHIWDIHELGLVKKERALQELLQDCRKDHDSDNQVCLFVTYILILLGSSINFKPI